MKSISFKKKKDNTIISNYSSKGFTLIELLVVIGILGALATLLSGQFVSSLKKGRDARRKSDLQSIQRAVELFYEDKKQYPTWNFLTAGKLCETSACSSGEKIYMQKTSNDPSSGEAYKYTDLTGSVYKLYSCIENSNDKGPGVVQSATGYGISCGSCGYCKFGVSSPNTTP